MIGYGDLVPRTEAGKIATIVYAVFGIPVYILYFMNMGKVFANILKWVYTKAYRWNVKRKWKQSANYDPLANAGEDIELDEAYHYEISQKVRYSLLLKLSARKNGKSNFVPRGLGFLRYGDRREERPE